MRRNVETFDVAVDWLLESRFMDPDALTMFWAIVDGDATASNVEQVDIVHLRQMATERFEGLRA